MPLLLLSQVFMLGAGGRKSQTEIIAAGMYFDHSSAISTFAGNLQLCAQLQTTALCSSCAHGLRPPLDKWPSDCPRSSTAFLTCDKYAAQTKIIFCTIANVQHLLFDCQRG